MIHLYTICYNEERMLPFFLRHYEQFADRIFVWDNHSTDCSSEILKKHPMVSYDTIGDESYRERDLLEVKNFKYMQYSIGQNVDWIIALDIDEILYHPQILKVLDIYKSQNITLPRVDGYQMVADVLPDSNNGFQIYDLLNKGVADEHYGKSCIFNPYQVFPHYHPGCHDGDPVGNIKRSRPELKLFHYKYVDEEHTVTRQLEIRNRMSKSNHYFRHGFHFLQTEMQVREQFQQLRSISSVVV